jgi:hypothetical protein
VKKYTFVEITKIKAVELPKYRTSNWAEYKPGEVNEGVSIPVEYTMKGVLLIDVVVGEPIIMERHERNGVKVYGVLVTSHVTKIEDNLVYTDNSVYKVTVVDDSWTVNY